MLPRAAARGATSPRWALVLVLLAGAGALVGTAPRSGARTARATPLPRTHVVEIRGFAFEPAVLDAEPGDTVVWVNRDVVPHTATAQDRRWDTGNIAAGASARRVLGADGDASYYCLYHPGMKGRLNVRRGAGPPAPQQAARPRSPRR